MNEYFSSVKALAHHLFIIGEFVPHKYIVRYILCGLGLDYCGFITSLNMGKTKPNIFELQSILMREGQLNVTQSKDDELRVLQANFGR